MYATKNAIQTFTSPETKLLTLPRRGNLPAKKSKTRPLQTETNVPPLNVKNHVVRQLTSSVACELELIQNRQTLFPSQRKLLKAYINDCDKLNTTDASVRAFINDCIYSSLVYGSGEGAYKKSKDALLDLTEILFSRIDTQLVPPTVETTADLVANNDIEPLQDILTQSLWNSCEGFTLNLMQMLQHGVEEFLVGRVQYGGSKQQGNQIARYWYTTRRVNERTRDFRDELTNEIALHAHDLVEPELQELPALGVPKPPWVYPIMNSVPKVFRRIPDAIQILTGDITLERVVVREPVIEKSTFNLPLYQSQFARHRDPAIIIANTWVLAAWGPTDIRANSQLRPWIPDVVRNSPKWHEISRVVEHRQQAIGQKKKRKRTRK